MDSRLQGRERKQGHQLGERSSQEGTDNEDCDGGVGVKRVVGSASIWEVELTGQDLRTAERVSRDDWGERGLRLQ